jgi:pSer/pThr/pTyr-binding forkhead associated (FHA) protein
MKLRFTMLGIHGELVPTGGGDPIPLRQERLVVGRRESCDLCFDYPNVSGIHCELSFKGGYWYIKDLNSTNGIKVNGARVPQKMLYPGDEVTIAKRSFLIQYELPLDRKGGLDEVEEDVLTSSLLERAGLEKPKKIDKPSKKKSRSVDIADFLLRDDE